MKRAAIIIVGFGVLGFVGGFIFVKITSDVVPTMTEYRKHGPTRGVSKDWHFDKWSPGHTQHVVNQALECNLCHDPGREDFKEVDIGVCTSCHTDQANHPHLDEHGEITECFTCHNFKFVSDADGPWDCARCHGPFDTPTHTGLAMHADLSCANCHHPHKPVAETASECGDCHKTFKVKHGRPELSGGCTDCHGGHKLASDASACMSCHQDKPSRVPETAVFGREGSGHDACVGCHEPHAFSKASATSCESCHKRQPVLAQNSARDHRKCSSCHDPHAVRRAGDKTCKGCHEEVVSTHTVEDQAECVSCHDPHPKRAAQIAMQCSSCHEEASSERAFHAPKAICTDCHQPHGFDLGHAALQSLCIDCHGQQARLTRRIPDHAECQSCHEGTAHELSGPVACASCHGDLQAASPEGHRECASCHEPHGGRVSAAETCTSCHENAGLPGLHRIPDNPLSTGHQECGTCHNVHDTDVRADRASCMECHDDIGDHEADAKVCTGCHTFISGKATSPLTPRATKRP